MEKNKITQTGGSINAGNILVGDNAVINSSNQNLTVSQNDAAELSKIIDDLAVNLNASKQSIPDKADILAATETLKAEVNKEKPSRITLMSIGRTILENLKYVKDIAPYAETLWSKISSLL